MPVAVRAGNPNGRARGALSGNQRQSPERGKPQRESQGRWVGKQGLQRAVLRRVSLRKKLRYWSHRLHGWRSSCSIGLTACIAPLLTAAQWLHPSGSRFASTTGGNQSKALPRLHKQSLARQAHLDGEMVSVLC